MSNPNDDIISTAITTESSNPAVRDEAPKAEMVVTDPKLRAELLREALPNCQPQEGSPANTFTDAELEELQAALPNMNLRPRNEKNSLKGNSKNSDPSQHQRQPASANNNKLDILEPWAAPTATASACKQTAVSLLNSDSATLGSPQEAPAVASLDWHGSPRFDAVRGIRLPRDFRQQVRVGNFTGPTNGACPGFLQCNLVVLPSGPAAFDFLLFCQRNPKACPLIEVCDVGSPHPAALAPQADLRTDCPKYAIYRDGKLEKEVTDVKDYWPENSVAFLIGCSFSYDGALMDAGIPLRSAEQKKNVPMYRTDLKCRSAGSLHGNMVVSMKPIPALQIAKEVEITSGYPHAHGGPVCIGRPDVIGIENLHEPDWGDAIDLQPDEVPVFHACGVTPQSVLMDSKVPFAITHAPGHMFVTDMPSDMGAPVS